MKKILCLATLGFVVSIVPSYAQQYDYTPQRIQPNAYQQSDYTLSDVTDLQNQLSSAADEINRLQSENYKLKKQARSYSTGAAANTNNSSNVVMKLQSQLSQKNHEAQMLRQQLQVANSNLSNKRQQTNMMHSGNSASCPNCTKKKNFFKRVFRRNR